MRHLPPCVLGTLILGILLAAGGCGTSALPSASALTSVRVVRVSTVPQVHIAPYNVPFAATQSDATQVMDLFTLLDALPPMPQGTRSCPADLGVAYDLAFSSGTTTALTGNIQATGCGIVTLGGTKHWWARDETFWARVSTDLGVPEAVIYPTTVGGGVPGAPTPTARTPQLSISHTAGVGWLMYTPPSPCRSPAELRQTLVRWPHVRLQGHCST